MSTKYRFTENKVAHFITMTLVEWVDLFSREKYKELIIENLNFCIKEKGFDRSRLCYHVQSSTYDLSFGEDKDLAGIIRDFKRFTAKKDLRRTKERS